MRPWRVGVGITMVAAGLGMWALVVELAYLFPYLPVLVEDYGVYIGGQVTLILVTFALVVYATARAVSLGSVGRKLNVVERAIRRGSGQDPELARALARDESGDYL